MQKKRGKLPLILSLQGCMAVGKTSAALYLKEHAPGIHVSLEENADVIAAVKERKLDKKCYADFLEIQRIWLKKEVWRWEAVQDYLCTVMDFGAEEIVFYTLNYPRAMGQPWEVEKALADELSAMKKCMPGRILFLDAEEGTLRMRKEKDASRSREFFDFYIERLLPLKRQYFLRRSDVEVLRVDDLSKEEVGRLVMDWVDHCIREYGKK